ncbi:proline-, glutamic acid- and leucine-rich protein 1-like [Hetaerina americana]|uniref:proline-, glutamic acid- and leucine-rich protein 1-like n=1 Tax=Hetaerina americana TaxID=62018 RepID=UPI003A7F1B93
MENLIDLFHTVSISPWRENYLNSFLSGCSEHQVFIRNNTSRLAQIVADINSKLNDGNSRSEGLLLLRTFLSQCPDEIFSLNAYSWASQALSATERKLNENDQKKVISDLPFAVLKQIVEFSGPFPVVTRQLSLVVSKILRLLTGYEIQDFLADGQSSCVLLQCLQSCMKYYSAQCVAFKGAIENLLLGLIFCKNESVIHEASKCFLLLALINPGVAVKAPQLTGGGNSLCTFLWNEKLRRLVATMYFALNELYANSPNFKRSSLESDKLDVPLAAGENSVLAIQSSATLYINLCHYLSTMLTHSLPAAKSIALEEVMSVVCQALSVSCPSLKDQVSAESLALSVCLPQVHTATFNVLSSLMVCSRYNLLLFGPLIVKLIMQSLKWTCTVSDWPSGVRKPYSTLRCSAYSCLSLWLRVSGCASSAEEVAEELVGMALRDIVPSREKLTLVSGDYTRKKLHGKHRKRQKVEAVESSITDKSSSSTPGYRCALGNGSANADICCAALNVLTNLLYSVGAFIKPNQHQILQEKTVSVLVDIQRSSHYISSKDIAGRLNDTNLILPYQSEARCRLCLYQLLLALVMEPHSHKWPPPVGLAAKIFETGANDPNMEVSTFCFTSKRSVERILHPCAPTLSFPITVSDSDNKQPAFLNSLIKRVISRERSALEINMEKEDMILKEKMDVRESIHEGMDSVESEEAGHSPSSESRSPSPEVITIDDDALRLKEKHPGPQSVGTRVLYGLDNGEKIDILPSNCYILSYNDDNGKETQGKKINMIPLPQKKIHGIEVPGSHEPVPNDLEPSSAASSTDRVLYLRLPLPEDKSGKYKEELTQRVKASMNSIGVAGDSMNVVLNEDGSAALSEDKLVSQAVNSFVSELVNGCGKTSDDKSDFPSDKTSCNPGGNNEGSIHVDVSSDDVMQTDDVMQADDVPDGPEACKESPVAKQKDLDEGHVSESEEMMSCFIDAAPDSE